MINGFSMLRAPLVVLMLVTVASCATVPPAEGTDPKLTEALKGKVAEKSQSCIRLDEANNAQVYNGAIVYNPTRGLSYVSKSPGCRSSAFDPIYVVEPLSMQLCRGDTVKMIDRASHMPNGFCILGDFTPYRLKR